MVIIDTMLQSVAVNVAMTIWFGRIVLGFRSNISGVVMSGRAWMLTHVESTIFIPAQAYENEPEFPPLPALAFAPTLGPPFDSGAPLPPVDPLFYPHLHPRPSSLSQPMGGRLVVAQSPALLIDSHCLA